jgi:glycosyltransferase involved in cell wall biosynthesis
MTISFIVTTYNIAPYLRQCLTSILACARPGDQVILVDDGSTDNTPVILDAFVSESGIGDKVTWTPVMLGSNTFGGVGIAANIGLDHVQCETVFFVDGDDYLIPEAFKQARAAYEAAVSDIHLTNYLEYDQSNGANKRPADAARWSGLKRVANLEEKRTAALRMIAVPWRKFYRTDFLKTNNIRFPEGDFFFEDNPFHWQVCLAAKSIGFSDQITCHHRINRPGQTMASTGAELTAFFTHYETIRAMIPKYRADLELQAARWVLGNMSWHLDRLAPEALYIYMSKAEPALRAVPEHTWQALGDESGHLIIWHYAKPLRQGRRFEVIEALLAKSDRLKQSSILKNLEETKQLLNEAVSLLEAQREIHTFIALEELRAN